MATRHAPETPTDFAGRLAFAMKVRNRTRSRTERESKIPRGYIQRLLGVGKAKQILSPGAEIIRQLADYLGVSYEWLAIGRGPMESEAGTSPLEQALLFARRSMNAREDAIRQVVEQNRDAEQMLAIDWVLAFDAAARRLDRAGVPRPEDVAKAHRTTDRLTKQKGRLSAELQDLEAMKAEIDALKSELSKHRRPGKPSA